MILLSGDVVPFNKQKNGKIKVFKVFFFQDPATVDERKLLLLLLRPLCEVLTWLHLLSALSCQTDDKGRTIFTLGVLFGNKTTKKRKELCKTAKSTLYNMLIGGKKKLPLLGIWCASKNVITLLFGERVGWVRFLLSDHSEIFLTSSLLTTVVLRLSFLWGRLRKSRLCSVCQWSEVKIRRCVNISLPLRVASVRQGPLDIDKNESPSVF